MVLPKLSRHVWLDQVRDLDVSVLPVLLCLLIMDLPEDQPPSRKDLPALVHDVQTFIILVQSPTHVPFLQTLIPIILAHVSSLEEHQWLGFDRIQVEWLRGNFGLRVHHRPSILYPILLHLGAELFPSGNLRQRHLLDVNRPRVNAQNLAAVFASRQVLDVGIRPWNVPIRPVVLLKCLCWHGEGHHLLELHRLRRKHRVPPTARRFCTTVCEVPQLAKLHCVDQNVKPN
mmetsp:Transcript_61353/g.154909  ORF Transcript_61353/g.154909 Transcript_61353/m.154909 type:complete len:230 (+) Transcript_61353:808-1497(+)